MHRPLTAILVGLLLVLPTPAASAASAEDQPDSATDEHRRIVDYWTPQRRANAVPRHPVLPSPTAKPEPKAKPDDSSTVTGATWTGGGDVETFAGKVFFTLNGTDYVCSGSAVDSTHGSLVLSAGHCVHGGGAGEAFATNWVFYPAYDSGPDPQLAEWTATDLFTTSAWVTTSNAFDHDAGFAVVMQPGASSLEQALIDAGAGTPGITFSSDHTGDYFSFGYPAAQKYKGQTLTYCAGPVSTDLDSNNTLALACDMTGGSSGGPWLRDFDESLGTGTINSLNSYGYRSLKGYMFGPIFDGPESSAYSDAQSGDCAGGSYCTDLAA